MNRYTAHQIIERALNLADIANTDFLTHKEQIQYLNDAWQTVYQWLINKGDKQFVKEVYLENAAASNGWTEYLIPSDLYQIKSLKNRITGDLILRQSESESINSGKYEIVNDRIRIYGNTNCPLLLTYWTTPTFITFPDKTIDVDINTNAIISSCFDSVLLNDGNIINCRTGETVATLSLLEDAQYKLGAHYYIEETAEEYAVKDLDGNLLNTITKAENTTYNFFSNKRGNILYQTFTDSKYSSPRRVVDNVEVYSNDDYEESGYPMFLANIDNYWIYNGTLSQIGIIDEETNEEFAIPYDYIPEKLTIAQDFNNQPCFYVTDTKNDVYIYTWDADFNAEFDKLKLRPEIVYANLRYGLLTPDGLLSVMPDTELNFPNDLYFSLLACDLALRYCMKMNSNTDGLSNLYANMQTTFMNTLSQDSGYTRIRSVY